MVQSGFLAGVLQPVLGPLLWLGSFWAIFLISLILTFLVTIIYKYTTNQKLMKSLKEELSKLQKDMKALRDKPEQMMKKQKVLMSKNMEYMKHSFRATLFTIIPVLIVFGWLSANLAYEPIYPSEPFNVTLVYSEAPADAPNASIPPGLNMLEGYPKRADKVVVYSFTGQAGSYQSPPLRFEASGKLCEVPVVVAAEGEREYSNPLVACKGGAITRAVVSNRPLKPLGDFSIFGWMPGWFGTYIVLSLVFSMVLRKILKVY
jgi:uncharacterized membrane protein (DUF106 family)